MGFPADKINAFYVADQQERESIRQDVLVERYADLQMEMENIESLLNISEQERDEVLFDINDMLFDIIETLVPELVAEEEEKEEEEDTDSGVTTESKTADSVEAAKHARAQKIKKRERVAVAIAKNTEKLKRAKSNIVTARLRVKSSQSPEAKTKAREGLRAARRLAVFLLKLCGTHRHVLRSS